MKTNINESTLFNYLFNLDNRDLPQSIVNWFNKMGSVVDSDRESAVKELSLVKGNCRDLVVFSKSFIEIMDQYCMRLTPYHMDVLKELDDENGVIRSPYFIEGCYVVYRVKNGCLTLWIFHEQMCKHLSIPTYYICAMPKDKVQGNGHQLDRMILPLCDFNVELNLQDYIDMVLDYLCIRKLAEVELEKISTNVKKVIKRGKNVQTVTATGLPYYRLDCKNQIEIPNDNSAVL
ncbi:MAG: hypothetical protein HUK02_05120 [Bacteroidaceae bacterium]|nr:hypothetical protein [Bacteroidaceae bacterium]